MSDVVVFGSERAVGIFQIVLSFTAPDPDRPIQIIARLPISLLPDNLPYSCSGGATAGDPSSKVDPRTVVALRQGRTLLTTFHPELTRDDRFHEYFVRCCVLGLPLKSVKCNENGAGLSGTDYFVTCDRR